MKVTILFNTSLTDLTTSGGRATGVKCRQLNSSGVTRSIDVHSSALPPSAQPISTTIGNNGSGGEGGVEFFLPADHVVLAVGHSARSTFEMLQSHGVHLSPKPFAVESWETRLSMVN